MKTILFLLLLGMSVFVKADTTDYWHVYLNDSLVARYNNSEKGCLFLNNDELDSSTVIKIRYYTCAHSSNTINRIALLDSTGNVFIINNSIGTGEPVIFSFKDYNGHVVENGMTIFNVVLMHSNLKFVRGNTILFQIAITDY